MRLIVASYLDRLREELGAIRDGMDDLIDSSTIRNVNPNDADSGVFFPRRGRLGLVAER